MQLGKNVAEVTSLRLFWKSLLSFQISIYFFYNFLSELTYSYLDRIMLLIETIYFVF